MSSRTNDPTEWANKRKAQIERAKLAREERKNGGQPTEEHSFQPQVNKRPQYLSAKHPDSLDAQLNQYAANPNDIMEQPLPGAGGKAKLNNFYNDDSAMTAPVSPKQDSLGNELKKYSKNTVDVSKYESVNRRLENEKYKSAFLNQYENDPKHANNKQPPPQHQQRGAHQYNNEEQIPGPYSTNHNNSKKQMENPDEAFANMLRSGGNGGKSSSGPGWNDDFTSGGSQLGFGQPPPIKKKTPPPPNRSRAAREQQLPQQDLYDRGGGGGDIDQGGTAPPARQKVAPRRRPVPAAEWNDDTETPSTFAGFDSQPTHKVSPRGVAAPSAPAADANVVRQARSKLGLLKSKIRQSESGGGSRNMNSTNAMNSQSTNSMSSLNTGEAGTGGGYDKNSGMSGNGRKTAPNAHAYNNGGGRDDDDYYEPTYGQPKSTRPRAQQQQDTEYGVSGVQARQQEQRQSQQRPQAKSSNSYEYNPSDRFDDEPSIPAARQPVRQSRHQQQQQQQDAYPPKTPPVQARRAAPVAAAPVTMSSNFNSNSNSSSMPSEYPDEYGPPPDESQMRECPDCGRKFNPKPYERHVKICAKVFLEKRKTFDSTKMRVADNPELVKILTKAQKEEQANARKAEKAAAQTGNRRAAPAPAGKAGGGGGGEGGKWKEQSEALREAMKAARQVSKAIKSGGPLPDYVPSAPDPSLIPCPHCGRRFNQKAGERHIPQCQNIKNKPTQLQRGKGGGGGLNGNSTKKKSAGHW